MSAKSNIPIFLPAGFCAMISMMALFMGENAKPAFFAFLPMCFFFVGTSVAALNKRVSDLEERLRQQDGGGA